MVYEFPRSCVRHKEVNDLKIKVGIFIILVVLIALIVIFQKDKPNGYASIEEAMINSNIVYDEIYYITEYDFCFSDTPVNYDPDVVRIYKHGETKTGSY